jgi:hypothetical protein
MLPQREPQTSLDRKQNSSVTGQSALWAERINAVSCDRKSVSAHPATISTVSGFSIFRVISLLWIDAMLPFSSCSRTLRGLPLVSHRISFSHFGGLCLV